MKYAVLLSGGVDSAVALRLAQQAGHSVTAFYLKIWLEDELSFLGTCPWEDDLRFAKAVCEQAGVELRVMNMQRAYWDHVVASTIASIKAGATPNPDMLCNQRVKFGFFLDAIKDEFDGVITGHYARVEHTDQGATLWRAPDAIKDQTYFLAYISQAQLSRAWFPLGRLSKQEVRSLAAQYDLPNKDRKDSQGICFLGKLKFTEFVKFHCGERTGNFVEYETGQVIGHHKGSWFFTPGQRQGMGLAGGPWYVVGKDSATNTVFISRSYYDEDKLRNSLTISQTNWFNTAPAPGSYLVKLRHGPYLHTADLHELGAGRYKVQLTEQDQGIAAGQFAVIYRGEECLGAGIIEPEMVQAKEAS
jgi:tRNA-specific 2-thiouridylase